MLKGARREHKSVMEIAKFYTDAFFDDCRKLNIKRPDVVQPATGCIDEYIKIITTLLEKGYAYPSGGDVYFRAEKFAGYGKLSHQPLDELKEGASERGASAEQKESPMDFTLWKAAKEGEPFWESPWGKGRPGWHIECSAMSGKYLGKTIDIHCGGQDLIFPHHENEIAQSECANGCEFSHYWMHNGYINVDNRKMSKSLGNFFTVRDVAAKYGYEPIRYLMISSHYRSPINYSVDIIEANVRSLERLYSCRDSMDFAEKNASCANLREGEAEVIKTFDGRREQFIKAMDDDLNTADGLSALFELVRDINTALRNDPSAELCKIARNAFSSLPTCSVLFMRKRAGTTLTRRWKALSSSAPPRERQRILPRPTQSATSLRKWA